MTGGGGSAAAGERAVVVAGEATEATGAADATGAGGATDAFDGAGRELEQAALISSAPTIGTVTARTARR